MRKQSEFPDLKNTRLDDKIQRTMRREFPLPEEAEAAKNAAFAQIRNSQADQDRAGEDKTETAKAAGHTKKKRKALFRTCAGMAAAAAVFSAVCITNPTLAAQIPLVGHVFEEIGQSLGFSGDFSKYAKPIEGTASNAAEADRSETDGTASDGTEADGTAEGENQTEETVQSKDSTLSATHDGMTVTLSEVYCNDVALYVSMVIQTEEAFPETMLMDNKTPVISLTGSTMKFSYNDTELPNEVVLDGKMIDEHTYAGVIRYNLSYSEEVVDYEAYKKKQEEFYLNLGLTRDEVEHMSGETDEKICALLGVESLDTKTIIEAGGPDLNDYITQVEIPDSFSVELTIPQVIGSKPDGAIPEMPEDLQAEYEQAMKENGLGLSDEDYAEFTEEQKEIEHELFQKMWNAYQERYPETAEHPNKYENWWTDGPWSFHFEVTKDTSETIVKEINDVDENGIGLVSVTKTPFELTVEDGGNYDCFTVVLDADGDMLETGTFAGLENVRAVRDHDVSKVDVYICDYDEYMDELKGYYYKPEGEEKGKDGKTFKQILDERALYHKEVTFEE